MTTRPPSSMTRRTFLARTGAAAPAAAFLTLSGRGPGETSGNSGGDAPSPLDSSSEESTEPLFRISLAEWSLHRTLRAGTMDNLDFPGAARTEYGIEAVEYVNSFFKEKARDRDYLGELKSRCDGHGVRSLLIMCDGEGAIGDPDPAARTRAVENHYRWVEAARLLGCHSVRVNARSAGSRDEQQRLAADGLRRLTEFAADYRINVLVENHGGLSSDGQWLAGVMEAVDHPRCGTLPDFGNFDLGGGETYDPYRGIREVMPYARAVSAKAHAFDARGNERDKDFHRLLRIVLEAGYRGYVGIEYEGSELSEPEGIRATKALLERVREVLEQEFA